MIEANLKELKWIHVFFFLLLKASFVCVKTLIIRRSSAEKKL